MIQIMGIRTFPGEGGKIIETDGAFFKKNWRAESVAELFANLDKYIEQIPIKERVNLFFTAPGCTDKKREFLSADVVWFDIDSIETSRIPEYVEVFCHTFNVKESETGIVSSGRGLHFYIGITTPIVDKGYFAATKDHYKALLDALGKGFAARGLPHGLDPSVWSARQLMRLPGTRNEKEGKAPAECRLLQSRIIPVAFDITMLSGLPTVDKTEAIDAKSFQATFKPDTKFVFQGCEFLKYCKSNPGTVTEPEWYAALSITARLPDGNRESHGISEGHSGYSFEETETKIEQALKASGPRTCKNINNIWGACSKCPNFDKVSSPILLRDPNEIRTEAQGFHHYHMDKNGIMKKGEPCYEDLVKFFKRKHAYKCTSKVCFTYNGKFYAEYKDEYLASFAQTNFKPECRLMMCREFEAMIHRTELVDSDAWTMGTERKVNFQNGVLDVETGELLPHNADQLFKYCLPFEYNPNAKSPAFDKFMDEVTGNDSVMKQTLLEFGGYALSGDDCSFQKALLLEGEGANGKSTFMDTIKAVAGKRGYSSLSFQEMINPDRRTPLDGALFNITEETPRALWDTTVFKALVAGGEVQVRHLYKTGYSIQNRAKLIFSCNELPTVPDASRGFFRRFLIIPFRAHFSLEKGNVDKQIGKKLAAELPGIFNQFLDGYRRLKEQGAFTKELQGDDKEMREYKSLADPVQYWFDECVVEAAGAEVEVANLYKSYRAFCDTHGLEKQALPSNVFGKRLKQKIPDYEAKAVVAKREGRAVRLLKGFQCDIHGDKEF
jgi:putative DNA primase/helicase